ncbi:hypothetical protein CQ054_22920 [Ochrobactrum sp. MYb29]|nr:hypothetical protein CQ054_22920 [Ochrobactrum sp. MYb29]
MKALALLPLLATFLVGQQARADDQYPCKPQSDDLMQRWAGLAGMDPTYKVRRYLGPHTFDIPYGYFTGRPTPERVNCYPKETSLEFAFWLPDLRPPKKDMWYEAYFRPAEEGRPAPGPDEYVVTILGMSFVDTSKGESETPSRAFSNRVFPNEITQIERKYGMLHVLTDKVGAFQDTFADLSQPDYKIAMICSTPGTTDENPLCKVRLYLTDLQLEAILLMPVDAVPQWQKVKDGVRTLVEQWRVKP